jgi:hypothetical protein
VPVADKVLEGVTRIRLDASAVPAHSDKELAEPNFKGFGHHPLTSRRAGPLTANARTRPAREAFLRRFEREVDPDGVLRPPSEADALSTLARPHAPARQALGGCPLPGVAR